MRSPPDAAPGVKQEEEDGADDGGPEAGDEKSDQPQNFFGNK